MDQYAYLRYAKQIILKDVGLDGQKRLQQARVLVAGAGGLGSPALYYLAAAGIGTLGLADFDQVGLSNLHRQILYSARDVGRKKVDAATEKLTALNAEIQLICHPQRLDAENLEEILTGYDVVIDATDNVTARYLVSDACYMDKKPLVAGAVQGFDGMVMTIVPPSPCYRCLYPAPPADGVLQSCTETGVIGAAAGIIGSMEAMEALKIVLKAGEPLTGRVLALDGLSMSFEEIKLTKRNDCPLCGSHPGIHSLEPYYVQCRRNID